MFTSEEGVDMGAASLSSEDLRPPNQLGAEATDAVWPRGADTLGLVDLVGVELREHVPHVVAGHLADVDDVVEAAQLLGQSAGDSAEPEHPGQQLLEELLAPVLGEEVNIFQQKDMIILAWAV